MYTERHSDLTKAQGSLGVRKAPTNYKQPLWLLNSVSKVLLESLETVRRWVKTLGLRNLRIFELKNKKTLPLLGTTLKHCYSPASSYRCAGMWSSNLFEIYFLSFSRSSTYDVLMIFTNPLNYKLHEERMMSSRLFSCPQCLAASHSCSINTCRASESVSHTILISALLMPITFLKASGIKRICM